MEEPAPVVEATPAAPPTGTEAAATETPAMMGGGEAAATLAEATPAAPSWRDALSDTTRDDPSVTRYDSLQGAVDGLISANKMIGHDSVVKPRNDTPEEMERFYNDLGAPVDAEGYDFTGMTAGDEEIESSDWVVDGMRGAFKEEGLLNSQARGVIEKFNVLIANHAAEVKVEQGIKAEQATAAVRQEWGSDFDNRLAIAEDASESIFGDELRLQIARAVDSDGIQFGSRPDFVKALHAHGVSIGEDGMGSGGSTTARTPAAAKAEISQLYGDPAFMKVWGDLSHPNNQEFQKKMSDLQDEVLDNGGQLHGG